MTNDNTLLNQIAINLLPNVGPARIRMLLSYFGNVENIFAATKNDLMHVEGFGRKVVEQLNFEQALELANKELLFIKRHTIKTHFITEDDYPFLLRQCNDAPILLFSKGEFSFTDKKIVSIVGTRNATHYGLYLCEELIQSFIGKNILVASGLAFGIDGIVHDLCIKYNVPTIGVLAHGLDRIYPKEHTSLAKQMLRNGGLLTEFFSGTTPDRTNFPMRNRVVAGVSDATIVVESGQKGGSLITANLANDYNREVFAFPGNVNQEYSEGCNEIIKKNIAQLITSGKEFLDFMDWGSPQLSNDTDVVQTMLFDDLQGDESSVFNLIKQHKVIDSDTIYSLLNIEMDNLNEILFNLEMMSYVKSLPGNRYSLI